MCVNWDALSSIATVVAVIVALAANRKATQQLKSALEMQEQSKNVGLFDRRVELAEKIKSGNTVPEFTLKILFNDNIYEHYQKWQNYLSEGNDAQGELEKLRLLGKMPDGEGGYIQITSSNEAKLYQSALNERIDKADNNARGEQEITLQLIEKFIADSIRPVGTT
jgi:hypothetical protein